MIPKQRSHLKDDDGFFGKVGFGRDDPCFGEVSSSPGSAINQIIKIKLYLLIQNRFQILPETFVGLPGPGKVSWSNA